MKRMKRILALTLAVVLCLSLSGCRWLDKMKEAQGKWQEDGTFVMNGYVYKPIRSSTDDLNVYEDFEMIYVTEPDVPVLLSEIEGDYGYGYCDNILAEVYVVEDEQMAPGFDVYMDSYYGGAQIYCRADYYNSVVDRIENGYELSVYSYFYWPEDYSEYTEYILTDQERAAVDEVVRTVEPIEVVDEMGYLVDNGLSITLEGYTSDRLFTQTLCDIYKFEGGYTICYSLETEDYEYVNYAYVVPDEYNPTFDKIFKACIDNMSEEELDKYNDFDAT